MDENFEPSPEAHQLVKDMYEIWDNLNPRTLLEDWHDAQQIEESLDLFSHGINGFHGHVPTSKACIGVSHVKSTFWHKPRNIYRKSL